MRAGGGYLATRWGGRKEEGRRRRKNELEQGGEPSVGGARLAGRVRAGEPDRRGGGRWADRHRSDRRAAARPGGGDGAFHGAVLGADGRGTAARVVGQERNGGAGRHVP